MEAPTARPRRRTGRSYPRWLAIKHSGPISQAIPSIFCRAVWSLGTLGWQPNETASTPLLRSPPRSLLRYLPLWDAPGRGIGKIIGYGYRSVRRKWLSDFPTRPLLEDKQLSRLEQVGFPVDHGGRSWPELKLHPVVYPPAARAGGNSKRTRRRD